MTNEKYDCEFCKDAGYYRVRNCQKYYPEQANNPKYSWEPEFTTRKGSIFGISEIGCKECPASFITPSSRHLIQIEIQHQIMKDSTGASLYGPNLAKWPSRIVDAFTRIASVRNEYENARDEAQMDENP